MGKLITISTFVVCIGFWSHAEHGKPHNGPCAKDRETLCGNIEHGDGRVMKCMDENKDKLSAECKEHREKMSEKRKEVQKELKEACHDDVEKFCDDVEQGQGRIMKCMKDYKDELSSGCKQEVESIKAKHKKGRKAS